MRGDKEKIKKQVGVAHLHSSIRAARVRAFNRSWRTQTFGYVAKPRCWQLFTYSSVPPLVLKKALPFHSDVFLVCV